MKRTAILLIGFLTVTAYAGGQRFITRTGFAGFYSSTPLEDIKAENNQVYAVIDLSKKELAFSMLLKGFSFPKELMQEHFNENYVESDKYPKASFTGSFEETVDLSGPQPVQLHIRGMLSLHGVTKPFATTALLEAGNGLLKGSAQFEIIPADFNIRIPGIVRDKIAKQIAVQIKVNCKPAN